MTLNSNHSLPCDDEHDNNRTPESPADKQPQSDGQDTQPPVPDSKPDSQGSSAEAAELNPFDPARLRLSQDFAATLGVKKAMLTVPVRKPSKEWWVRVHPDESYRLQTAVLELKEERETYLVDPVLWPELAAESTFSPRMLFTTVNRQGVLFLWPIRLPGPDGKIDEWSRSALEAAEMAQKGWVRVAANMDLGAYDVFEATGSLPDPEWPSKTFGQLLEVAFKGHFVRNFEHSVLRQLRGEV